jgi:hypothetical protein
MISAACCRLLDATAHYHPAYGGGLANHLPMALIALDAIGASSEQLERFTAHYSPRLTARGPTQPPLEPAAALGKRECFEAVRSHCIAALERRGADAVLREWLPRLLPGVSASAFHALIRLAYGLEAQRPDEIATALAYWVIEYRTLGELSATSPASLQQISATAAAAVRGSNWGGRLIIDRMAEVAAHPALQRVPLQPEHIDAHGIARFALERYVMREDFTLLHLVTGCHAFAVIAGHAGEPQSAARYLWQAVLFALLTTREEPSSHLPYSQPNDWQQCLRSAASSLDDHVIKLVYTAWRQAASTRDVRYHYIAARKSGPPI